MTIPITEQQLKELAGKLRIIPIAKRSDDYRSIEAQEALALAVRIAEAIGKNPKGFMNWAKTTGNEI